ncbi:MAG: hypothetical protein GY696_12235 [Gammaproteobacteria bacterium]|nr:hypothetical protein [Gammaproteobacteria bacterium]
MAVYESGQPPVDRGFTGHRILPDVDLIHMNGRVYDANIGRFLSADPHIQFAGNLQSYNRYSYTMNNPLAYTDPSGYFLKSIFKSLKKLFKKIANIIQKVINVVKKYYKFIKENIKTIAAIAVVIMAPYALAAMVSTGSALLATSAVAGWGASLSATGMLVAGAIGGGLSGLVTTGTLKGAIIGALSGAVTAGIGNWGDAAMKAGKYSKMAVMTMKAGMHGIRGGVASVMNGGKFAAGFSSAGMSSFAGGYIGRIENSFGQAVAAGVVGGASSELAGGKFKDGFNEGVITHGLNWGFHEGVSGRKGNNVSGRVTYREAKYQATGNTRTVWEGDESVWWGVVLPVDLLIEAAIRRPVPSTGYRSGMRHGEFQHEMKVGYQEYEVYITGTETPWDFTISTSRPIGGIKWTNDTVWKTDIDYFPNYTSRQVCVIGLCAGW